MTSRVDHAETIPGTRRPSPTAARTARFAALLIAVLTVVSIGASAHAQSDVGAEEQQGRANAGEVEPVWARGVSDDKRRRAMALFEEGNRLALDFRLTEAVKRYQAALSYWDHPSIHYNLCRALNALNQPLAAHGHALRALEHGAAGLGESDDERRSNYAQMRQLEAALRSRLAELTITPDSLGTEMFVDQRPLPADGSRGVILLPGDHRLVAQKAGHRTLVQRLSLRAGASDQYSLTSKRPFAPWKPWALTSAGAAVGLAGGALMWHSGRIRTSLDRDVRERCEMRCNDDADQLRRKWSQARFERGVGVGAVVVGSGALLTGAALVLWNQQRRFRLEPRGADSFVLTPVVGRGHGALVGTFSF